MQKRKGVRCRRYSRLLLKSFTVLHPIPLPVFYARMECLLAYPGKTIHMKPAPEKHTMYYVLTSAVALAIIVQVLIKILT